MKKIFYAISAVFLLIINTPLVSAAIHISLDSLARNCNCNSYAEVDFHIILAIYFFIFLLIHGKIASLITNLVFKLEYKEVKLTKDKNKYLLYYFPILTGLYIIGMLFVYFMFMLYYR